MVELTNSNNTGQSGMRLWFIIAGACVLGIGGSLLGARWLDATMPRQAPPVLSVVTGDIATTERNGQVVRLSELRGKVVVCSYLYTVCPHGCAAVVAQMQKLHRTFGRRPDFHQVSVAVVPERDTPLTLSAYAEALGVKSDDPWWFLTGDRNPLVSFMTDELKLQPCRPIPAEERLNPMDLFEHDLRIVLIDRQGRVRGYYPVFHPQPEIAQLMGEKLQRDARTLIDHPEL